MQMKEKIEALSFKVKLNIHYLLCSIGGAVTMLGCHISKPYTLHFVAWLGITLIAAGIFWRILYIKCPHCGDGLYQSHAKLDYCPNCGKKLDYK